MAPAKKPITYKNSVNQLTWNVPITNPNGTPTDEFQRKWLQQAAANASIVNLTTAAGVSAVLDLIDANPGAMLQRGAAAWGGLDSPSDATLFLNGGAFPDYAAVKDSDLSLSDITANNATTARHGFLKKLPNDATLFLNGLGNFTAPASGGGGAASIQDDGTTVFIALSDADGQLVLDGSGDPIFSPEVFPASAIPAIAGYADGPYSAVVVHKVKGVTDGSNATAGDVGEIISASAALATVPVTNATALNVAFIDLTAGDWDVFGLTTYADSTGAGALTRILTSLSIVSGTIDSTSGNRVDVIFNGATAPGALSGNLSAFVGPVRYNVTTLTRVYLVGRADFSSGTIAAGGIIRARRMR